MSRGAQLLGKALARRKLSQQALEELLGVSSGIVSKWLAGKRRPSLACSIRLRDELGISPGAWLEVASKE